MNAAERTGTYESMVNSFKNNGWKFDIMGIDNGVWAFRFSRLELLTKATAEAAAIVDNYYRPADEPGIKISMMVDSERKRYWLIYEEID